MTKYKICVRVIAFSLAGAALFLIACSTNAQEATFKAARERLAVPGEILVKYKGMGLGQVFTTSKVEKMVKTYPVSSLATFRLVGVQHFKVVGERPVTEVLKTLQKDPLVEFAEPNYIVYATQNPTPPTNDPRWADLWGLTKIGMPKAWTRTQGSRKVIIAVIDTGIDYQHQDLKANVWRNPSETVNGKDDDGNGIVDDIYGANFCGGQRSGDPLDDNGHGTHVAGTIAAEGNNKIDIVGVGWQFQIMAVKFLCKNGQGNIADAIRGIEYALSKGAHILNNSWGGGGYSGAMEVAIREADRQGVLFVAAAGNEKNDNDRDPSYPASYRVPNVIAVGATTQQDALASFSNWGKTSVHVAAPGVSILSTIPGNRLASYNGTSMATPHVSGCAGLLKAINASRSAQDIRKILLDTADRVAALKDRVAYGRLNCDSAVLK